MTAAITFDAVLNVNYSDVVLIALYSFSLVFIGVVLELGWSYNSGGHWVLFYLIYVCIYINIKAPSVKQAT